MKRIKYHYRLSSPLLHRRRLRNLKEVRRQLASLLHGKNRVGRDQHARRVHRPLKRLAVQLCALNHHRVANRPNQRRIV